MQNALTLEKTYDFSRFDTSMKTERKADKKSKAKVKDAAREKPMLSGFGIMAWVIVMALAVAIVYSYMTLTEASATANRLQNTLTTMREETQMLEIKKEQKYGSQQLQEIAVTQLGMQKIQKGQITYVNTNTGDYTEVTRSTAMRGESPILAGIASGFNTFVEYLN